MSHTRHRFRLPVIALAVVAFAAVMLTGCNTVKGIGEDITVIGQAGEDLLYDSP